jgi:hypothetical protein
MNDRSDDGLMAPDPLERKRPSSSADRFARSSSLTNVHMLLCNRVYPCVDPVNRAPGTNPQAPFQPEEKMLTRALLLKDLWNYKFVSSTNLMFIWGGCGTKWTSHTSRR